MYILDTKECKTIFSAKELNSTIFIEQKEYNRIRSSTRFCATNKVLDVLFPPDTDTFEKLPMKYEFWHGAYFFLSENTSGFSPASELSFRWEKNDFYLNKTAQFLRNKGSKRIFSVYHLSKINPPLLADHDLIDEPLLKSIIEKGTLKSWSPEYDTYIFQVQDKLFWIIGSEKIGKHTSLIYHSHTNRIDLLPPDRVQYRFGNHDFKGSVENEIGRCGTYRIFQRDIPKEYPIEEIAVGFNNSGKVVLFKPFKTSDF